MLRLAAVLALLAAAPASAATPWSELRRDLHLPQLEAGESCPVSPVYEHFDWKALGLPPGRGRGPVFPGFGRRGRFPMGSDEDSGMFSQKLLWFVRPSYRDRALVRGHRIDGPGWLRFTGLRPSMRFGVRPVWRGTSSRPAGARAKASGIYADGPGCYALQIDGATFSRVVVFRVRVFQSRF